MKTILAPTDFSEVANHALDYAVQLANVNNAALVFLNVFHTPVITPENVNLLPDLEELEKTSIEALNRLRIKYENLFPGLNIRTKSICGLGAEEIVDFATNNSIDLIIMGMKGAGYLEEKLVGSVTTTVMNNVDIPVLTIDQRIVFKAPRKIILATDYTESQKKVFEPLLEFVKSFNSHLYVLKVVSTADYVPEAEEALEGIKLKNILEGTNHTFHVVANDSITEGVKKYAEKIEADLVVMIAKKHSFIHKLFHEPHTKHMAFHSHVPLLCLHEK